MAAVPPAVQAVPMGLPTMEVVAVRAVVMDVDLLVAIIPHHHVPTVRRNVPLYVKGSRHRHVQIALRGVLQVVETTVTIHAQVCAEENAKLHAGALVKENVVMAVVR